MDIKSKLGEPATRIDGIAKVTGAARYASDEPVPNPAFGYFVTSSIARGRITQFDLKAARAVSGVIDILTHDSFPPTEAPMGPDGKAAFFPIMDEVNVDKRRASVGLGPLADYARYFHIKYHLPKN